MSESFKVYSAFLEKINFGVFFSYLNIKINYKITKAKISAGRLDELRNIPIFYSCFPICKAFSFQAFESFRVDTVGMLNVHQFVAVAYLLFLRIY